MVKVEWALPSVGAIAPESAQLEVSLYYEKERARLGVLENDFSS